ncbi:MAG: GAF domain-containing sensor histidine kinase [Anaerolineae bacterium]|nr:GAF domain-containing sensor histidine kinase [Anaerolineae bacterium]
MAKKSAQILEDQVKARTRELERRRLVAEVLRDILVVLNSDRPRREILEYIAGQACDLFEADAGCLYRLDWTQGRVVVDASVGLPDATESPAGSLPFPPLEMWACGDDAPGILEYAPIAIADLSAPADGATLSPEMRHWYESLVARYRAALMLPLLIKGAVYGVLVLFYIQPQLFSDEDMRLGGIYGYQAALVLENAQLRTQAEQAAILEERNRLARDLHDSVTQSLYSLTVLAEAGRRLAKAGDLKRVEEAIARLGEIGQQALKEMRLLVYQLRPLALRSAGLVKALQQRLDTVERRAGVDVSLSVEGEVVLPSSVEEELYHIVLEALNNVLKHASATALRVSIRAEVSLIIVEVCDNGRGFSFPGEQDTGGIGLVGMQERAERLGGELAVHSLPGAGTLVRVTLQC